MNTRTLICKEDITRRAASDVCNILNRNTLNTNIYLKKQEESRTINAKSLLGLLSLVLKKGDICELCVSDDRLDEIVESLNAYFEIVE